MITTVLIAIAAAWPAPLAQALEPMTEERRANFDLEVVSDDFRAVGAVRTGETPPLTIVDANVPDTEARERLMEDNGDDLEGRIWCDGFASQVPDTVTTLHEDEREARYRYKPSQASAEDEMERKFFAHSMSTLTVRRDTMDAPWRVSDLVMTLHEPFKPNLAARVTAMDLAFSCVLSPHFNGRSYRSEMAMDVEVAALFQTISMNQRVLITNLRPIEADE